MSALISVNCPRGLGAGLPPRLRAPSSSSSRASRGTSASGRPSKYPRVGPPRRRLDPDTTLRFYAAVAARERAEARAAAAREAAARDPPRDSYPHKDRVMRALECVREDLADGSVMFRFVETVVVQPSDANPYAEEAERLSRHGKSHEYVPDAYAPAPGSDQILARWGMTVAFIASTASVERAAMYVLSTPFRAGFWAVAHALRLTFWACTGRLWNRGRRLDVVGYDDAVGGESPWDRMEMKERMEERRSAFLGGRSVHGRDAGDVMLG